jgi:hypothetical protein
MTLEVEVSVDVTTGLGHISLDTDHPTVTAHKEVRHGPVGWVDADNLRVSHLVPRQALTGLEVFKAQLCKDGLHHSNSLSVVTVSSQSMDTAS